MRLEDQIVSFADDKGFNGKISECIEKALDSLGEGVKQSFFHQIIEKYHLPREQFASRPAEIIEHLEEILGPTGSAVVERLIVREIRNKFGLEFRGNMKLSVVIQEARSKFLDVAD